MLRTLVILVAFAAAVLWVEPTWSRQNRTLMLRLRGGEELIEMGRAQTGRLARWVARETARRSEGDRSQERGPVGAPPPTYAPSSGGAGGARSLHNADEWITRRDQKQLDELLLDPSRD